MAVEGSGEAAYVRELNAGLDAGRADLVAEARLYGARLRRCLQLREAAERAGEGRFLPLHLAGSWQIGQLTAASWLAEADRFAAALPGTLARLEQGELLCHQAQVLLRRTRNCPVQVARAVEDEVLAEAGGLCPADLGKRVDRAVLRIESEHTDAAGAEQRHAAAAADRRVWTRPEPDGMALAAAVVTAEQMVGWSAAMDALERRERAADRAAGIERSADQRRADIFAALPAMALTGLALADTAAAAAARAGAGADQLELGVAGAGGVAAGLAGRPWTFRPEQVAATVVLNVHVPMATVLELSCEPGTLDGYGPISAEHVRLLRPQAYRRVLVDADTGRPLAQDDRTSPLEPDPTLARRQVQAMLQPAVVIDVDEPQHDPSARLARLIDLRDPRCTGPGCSSTRADRDHETPHPHGATSARNLHRLSPRCHAAKHAGWQIDRHPDGSVTWHHPRSGRSYHRPSPHHPPPTTNLHTPPPPLRPPPRTAAPWNSSNTPLGAPPDGGPEQPAAAPPRPPDDDPPPF